MSRLVLPPFAEVRPSPACLRRDRTTCSFPCSRSQGPKLRGHFCRLCAFSRVLLRGGRASARRRQKQREALLADPFARAERRRAVSSLLVLQALAHFRRERVSTVRGK